MGNGHTTIPSAVQRQEAAADAALAELEKMRSDEDQAVADATQTPEESAVETPVNTQDTFAEATEQKPTPAAEPEKVEKMGEENTVAKEEYDRLKRQFEVLQGKYNSEVPRYAAKVRELEAQNDSLKDELDKANETVKTVEVSAEAYRRYLTAEEQEDLDNNTFAEFNSRVARGVAEEITDKRSKQIDKRVDELQAKIDELNEAQYSAQTRRFWEQAEQLAPGLTLANELEEPGWVEFLGSIDPTSHLSYRDIGVSAVGRGDFEAVANLYNLYKGTKTAAPAAAPRRTAQSQVKPETSSSAPVTQKQPSGTMIRQSEIENFFKEAAKSGLSPAKIAEREAEFDRAADEGRIIFGR